uniref:AcidPPc domain-containing protein n=1 Tax=Steinernema glaseri TaxID=37863 RepID=A0A1I8AWK9_9BILA
MASTSIKFPLLRWVVAVAGLGASVLLSYLIPKWTGPVKRGFFCDDESIRYPYKENTIDPILLGCVCYFVVILTIIATEILYNRLCLHAGTYSSGQIPNYKLGSLKIPYVVVRMFFAFAASQVGLAVGVVLMNMTKYSVGRLRPHFIDACKPNVDVDKCGDSHTYIENFICTREDPKILADARLSFFSGHTSNAFYFALFCVLYVHLRLGHQFFDIVVFPIYYSLLLCAAAFVGYSRIFDYKHHWSDVMTGAIVGCFLAVITVGWRDERPETISMECKISN